MPSADPNASQDTPPQRQTGTHASGVQGAQPASCCAACTSAQLLMLPAKASSIWRSALGMARVLPRGEFSQGGKRQVGVCVPAEHVWRKTHCMAGCSPCK